jgi:uncharacterized protein with HEPN domain
MKRDFRLYLKEIFDAIDEIEEFTKGFTENDFVKNKMAVRAIITDLIIIGEAVDKIPKNLKYSYRQIPWRTWERMKETRNELAHEYYNVKPEVLWSIVKYELPPIKPIIKKIIDNETTASHEGATNTNVKP